jgi:3-oxoadipate enol-lactonase
VPFIKTDDGVQLHVQTEGPADAPALILSCSLGTDLRMWDDQAPALAKHFRLVRYDRRGHGQSGVPKGPYSMERFGRDVLAIADSLGIERFHWCGLSMGGMVGQWLGAHAPQRVGKLVLSNTNFHYADKAPWDDRIRLVREKGLAAIAPMQMERWFTQGFRDSQPDAVKRITESFVATKAEGFIACCEAIRDMDFRDSTPRISAPTLVIVGAHDPATPPSQGEAIHRMIEGSALVRLDAAHLSNVEQPASYLDALLRFLRAPA